MSAAILFYPSQLVLGIDITENFRYNLVKGYSGNF